MASEPTSGSTATRGHGWKETVRTQSVWLTELGRILFPSAKVRTCVNY